MKFWIVDEADDEYETFETKGHADTNLSSHLDAMKIAQAWGYCDHEGFYLHTEDGFLYDTTEYYTDPLWNKVMSDDLAAVLAA